MIDDMVILKTTMDTLLQFVGAYDGHCLIIIAFVCLYCENNGLLTEHR